MDHSGAQVLAAKLISAGIFSSSPSGVWPLFTGSMPNLPNVCAAIYETDGILDGREHRGGKTIMHPGWQIRFRTTGHSPGMLKGGQVEEYLDTIYRAVVVIAPKTYLIQATRRMSPVLPIGQEEGGSRYLFTLNGTITYGENP